MAGDGFGVGMLEREAERAELRVALAGAARGHGTVVLVEGPPGIGKTRRPRPRIPARVAVRVEDRLSANSERSYRRDPQSR